MRVVLVLISVLLSLVQSDEQCSTELGDFVAKRIKMKNKSNFARVSGIELTKELGRSSTRSLETCGQLCDESLECLCFEFDRTHSLCITASAYYLMDAHTLNTEIMETIKFIKLQNKYVSFKRGETEACIDDGKYKQIAQGQVVQWLKDHASSRPKEATSTKSSPIIVHSTSTTSAPDTTSTPQSHFTNGTSSSLTSSSPKEMPYISPTGNQPTTVAATVTQKAPTVTSTTTSKPGNNFNTTSNVSSSTTTPEAVTVISISTEAKATPTTTSSTYTTSSGYGSTVSSKATSSPLAPTLNTTTLDLTPVTESGDNSTSEEATVRLLPTVTTTKGTEKVKSTVGVVSTTDGGSTASDTVTVTLTEDTVEITESSAQTVEYSTTEQVNPTTKGPTTTFTDTTVDWSMEEREFCMRFCWSNKWMCERCRTTYPDDFDDQTTLAPTTTTTVATTTTPSRPLGVATSPNTTFSSSRTTRTATTYDCGRDESMRVDCDDNWASGLRLRNDSKGWWVVGQKDEQKYLICDSYSNVTVTCKERPHSECAIPVVVRGEYSSPFIHKCAESAKFDRGMSSLNNTCTAETVGICGWSSMGFRFECEAFPDREFLLAIVYCEPDSPLPVSN